MKSENLKSSTAASRFAPLGIAALAGLFVLAGATVGLAHGGGGGGGMGMGGGGMGMGSSMGMGGMSGSHGEFGGMSASHMSSRGLANTNGPNAADRDFGRARAEDRMNPQGLAHSKAGNGENPDDDGDADDTTMTMTTTTPQ